MDNDDSQIIQTVADYYSKKIVEHGSVPAGVDWNGQDSQELRFAQLTKIIQASREATFSLADIGCGYGAYYEFLVKAYSNAIYHGYDIAAAMCSAAKARLPKLGLAEVFCQSKPSQSYDYVIASGIFNVLLETDVDSWERHLYQTLDDMNETSNKGFAFNCLTSFSHKAKMRDYLYYADPMQLFDFCKQNYSRNVALLHDYDLFEFTILVRK